MDKIRVMLVDDHVLVRQGTRELLDREQDLLVVAEAGDGEEAVRQVAASEADVILMDLALPKMDGLEATKRIKEQNPDVAVLMLTAYDDDEYVLAFLDVGASGYLLKDASAEDLIRAIRAVHAGDSVLHPAVTRKMIEHFRRMAAGLDKEQDAHMDTQLTERELEVLEWAGRGMTNREIGGELCISPRTVQVHMSNICGKLGVGSRTEAVLYAVREGWLSLEDIC
jgi:DNA-binding NarL/FixJ family response regulator